MRKVGPYIRLAERRGHRSSRVSDEGEPLTNITTAWKTDKGPRPANEDSCLVLTREELGGAADGLLAVADGMGGRASGATASGLTIEAVRRAFTSGAATADDLGRLLSTSLIAANTDVVREAGTRPEFQGMGTTCVAAAVKDDKLFIAHVGDSRGYLLRDGRLLRLTEDHSIVAEKVRSGEMTEDQARRSRFRNVITKAIGLDDALEPDVGVADLRAGDVILLCSDGLTGPLHDTEIAEIIGGSPNAVEACSRLIRAALKNGGSDNVTVAILAYGRSGARVSPSADSPAHEDTRAPVGVGRKIARILVPGLLGIAIGLSLGLYAEKIPVLDKLHPEKKVVLPAPELDMSKFEYGIPASLLYTPLKGDVLCLSNGGLRVAEKNGVLREVDKTGRVSPDPVTDDPAGQAKLLSGAKAVDRQGNLYVSDRENKRILRFDVDGKSLKPVGDGQLIGPEALAVDKNGDIFVIDGGRLKVIRPKPVSSVPSVP